MKGKADNKGFVAILDALIALSFFVLLAAIVETVYEPVTSKTSMAEFKNLHYLSEDILDVLNKQGVLDEIGTEWAAANGSNTSDSWKSASNLTKAYLDRLIPERYGYKLVIDDNNTIYDSDDDPASGRPDEGDTDVATHSSRLLVGYGKGLPTRGEVARAFLTNIREKVTSSYAYFGGFEGEGSITKYVTLPNGTDTIQSICLEYDAADNYNLTIDGKPVANPSYFPQSAGNMSANSQCIASPGNYLPPLSTGTHVFNISFTGGDLENQYISGGFIKVTYNTSEYDTSPETGTVRYEFPGINGLINLYSSFYVPGTLNSMNMHLHFDNNYTTYLTIGNVEVFNTSDNGRRKFCSITNNRTYTCDIPNQNLTKIMGGPPYPGYLSQQTIPLRMGVRNITALAGMIGTADVVLITDLSGSMGYYIGSETPGGQTRTCSDPHLYDNDTSRLSLAKCVDVDFINKILDGSGNRVGLVGFETDTTTQGLTTNAAPLISTVNGYSAMGGTCICCAINKAMSLFNDSIVLIQNGSDWKYKRNQSCGDACDPTTISSSCNITGWRDLSFNDTSWGTLNPVTTGDNASASGNVVYYRKHINVSAASITGNATLKIRNQRGVECYLNGNLIGKETTCGTASYWDWTWSVPKTYFNSTGTDNVLACRVRSGTSSGRTGTAFNAMMTSSQKRYIIVMTDGVAGYSCGECGSSPACSNPAGLCSRSCTQTSADPSQWGADYRCTGSPPGACTDSACQPAMNDAICSARKAYNSYYAKLYSVGFGPVANCSNGAQTLQQIAQCGNATYYASNNASQLQIIYDSIANEILNTTKESQVINVTGDMVPSVLYPDSYVDFSYNAPTNYSTYGEISITQNTDRFNKTNNCTGYLYVPSVATVSDAMVTSYSSEHWTDYVKVNNNVDYTLRDNHFGSDYTLIGDPYIVHIPPSMINSGQNNSLFIETGDNATFHTNCSKYDSAIFTVRVTGRVGYGNVFPYKDGCNWTIEFEDGTNITEMMPANYNGTKKCSYTGYNATYDTNDAIDDAVHHLLQNLDTNANDKLDIKFDPNMIQFDFSQSGGVQSLWGPISMKLIVWTGK